MDQLTWINLNNKMDEKSDVQLYMELLIHSQTSTVALLNLEMDKLFHHKHYNGCNYLITFLKYTDMSENSCHFSCREIVNSR